MGELRPMHPMQKGKRDVRTPLLSVQIHLARMEIGKGVAWPRGSRDPSMAGGAQYQTLMDKHVEAQYGESEGHGFPYYACWLGHLEREKR